MFEFTTLSVYNNISVATPNQIKNGTAEKGYNVINNTSGTSNPYVRIGNTRFNPELIAHIEIRMPSKEYLAEVKFDLSKIAEKMPECDNEVTGRIGLYIGLSMNSLDSFYANDFVYKGKPFFIEFPIKRQQQSNNSESESPTTGPTGLAASVKKIIDKYMLLMTDEKILNVIVDSEDSNGNTIIIQGVNGYQLIRKAVLLWYNPEAKSVDCCTNQGDYETIVTGVPVMWNITNCELETGNPGKEYVYDGDLGRPIDPDTEVAIKPGLEAFGDYNWIIHNLRLPTLANTHFWSPTKNEMPVPGQYYYQVTITMRDTNKGTAGNDIGQVTACQTTHVLYIANKLLCEMTLQEMSNSNIGKIMNLFALLMGDASHIDTTVNMNFESPFGEPSPGPSNPIDDGGQ